MTTRRSLLLGAAGAVTVSGLAGLPGSAFAQGAVIDITRARTAPIPIAIPDFAGAGDGQRYGRDIARVVQANLRNSGLFRPVERQAFIQTPEAAAQTPRFQDVAPITLAIARAGWQLAAHRASDFRCDL